MMEKLMNLFDDLNWEEANEYYLGTQKKVLRESDEGRTVLLKLPAGFNMLPHSHVITEQHFVIKGEYESNGSVISAGSYQVFYPGDEHGPFKSKDGALVLVIWDATRK